MSESDFVMMYASSGRLGVSGGISRDGRGASVRIPPASHVGPTAHRRRNVRGYVIPKCCVCFHFAPMGGFNPDITSHPMIRCKFRPRSMSRRGNSARAVAVREISRPIRSTGAEEVLSRGIIEINDGLGNRRFKWIQIGNQLGAEIGFQFGAKPLGINIRTATTH